MKKPIVSIIIPMYNEQRYIARCLDSLKQQTYKDFELILIDDGSKDNTVEIAKQYHKDLDLTILQQKNSGPGKARNRGAKEAKGDVLVFVDADMFFDKNYIKYLIQPIVEGKEIGTAHGSELVGNIENRIARAYGLTRGVFEDGERSKVFRAFTKKAFIESGGYDNERYAFEDNFEKKVGTALFIKKVICYHNNPESLSEIFNHEIRIGESLIAKGEMKHYLFKYRYRIYTFGIIGISLLYYLIKIGKLYILPVGIINIIMLFIIVKTIQRTIKEGYLSHIIYIPLVMIIRGTGYIWGIIKNILTINRKKGN